MNAASVARGTWQWSSTGARAVQAAEASLDPLSQRRPRGRRAWRTMEALPKDGKVEIKVE